MNFDVTKEYSREDFEDFIRDFLPDDFESAEEEIYIDKKNIVQAFQLGKCESLDLSVFEFRTGKTGDPRVSLTVEARNIMKKFGFQPHALAAFYNDESKSWRFSLITTDYEIESETGKKKATYSNPRRFSFLLGEGCKRHTPEEMLIAKGQIRERTENGKKLSPIEDLKSRFDIEVVTKEFYNELFTWYEWACSLAKYPVGKADKVLLTSSNNEQSLIRLITRLIFVWFIKQKDLIPSWIFDENELGKILSDFNSQSSKSGNYYNAVLQNLFFATLNKKIEERKFTDDNEAFKHYGIKTLYRDDSKKSFFKVSLDEVVEKFKSVPFLNGGLFECLDRLTEGEGGKNEQIYEDGFSREEKRRAFLPNSLFFQKQIPNQVRNDGQESHEGIVHILNRYNFTVEENSPSDVQVALDPELLGKVFENLLGTYNPETSETARKDSGSFYTPREIVNFMVNESLISYLIDDRRETLDVSQTLDVRNQTLGGRSETLVDSKYKKIGERNEHKELRGFDSLAEINGFDSGSLQTDENAAKGRNVFSARPNEAGGGFNSVKHSGRFWKEDAEGISTFHSDSERLNNGTGNSAENLPENKLPDGGKFKNSFGLADGNSKDDFYNSNSSKVKQTVDINQTLDVRSETLDGKQTLDGRNETLEKKKLTSSDYRLTSNKIRHFVETEDASQFSDEEKKEIVRKLENIKVLDPACGSGAFPVGMLQKLVSLIRQAEQRNRHAELDSASTKETLKQVQGDNFSQIRQAEQRNRHAELDSASTDGFRNKFGMTNSDYSLKLHLIENCLYGVDIQTIAVQICKLRFFITLICEQEKNSSAADNYGFNPLPNLETKFVAADSLVGLAKNENKNLPGELFLNPEISKTKDALQETRRKHFSAPNAAMKKKYREDDKRLREKLAKLLADDNMYDNKQAKQLAAWNPYDQNAVSSFFDAFWMFGIKTTDDSRETLGNGLASNVSRLTSKNGFDIVLGNPPYIQLQKNGGELAKKYEGENFKSFAKTGDIYCLFYERGFDLLKNGGHLCFITSNKWMRAGYGEKLREFLSKNTKPELLIDFAGVKIFESATVDTNILLFEKRPRHSEWSEESLNMTRPLTTACVTKNLTEKGLQNLSGFVQQNAVKTHFDTSESWVVLSPIEQSIKQKIEKAGVPLKDWDIQINYGIKTGYNDAFIITTEKRNEILAECKSADEKKRTEELIRPILRGRDIKRYGYDWAGLWLIATFPSRHYDIEKYPAVKKHLLTFGMERLEQTGKEHIVNGEKIKARKKTNNKWFETQDSISYWEDFGRPKVMYADISQRLSFAFSTKGEVLGNTAYFFTGNNLRYLLKVLNTNLFDWYYRSLSVQLGEKAVRMFSIYVLKLPVPEFTNTELQQKIVSSEEDSNIEELVYHLYGLSDEEIAFIENQ